MGGRAIRLAPQSDAANANARQLVRTWEVVKLIRAHHDAMHRGDQYHGCVCMVVVGGGAYIYVHIMVL